MAITFTLLFNIFGNFVQRSNYEEAMCFLKQRKVLYKDLKEKKVWANYLTWYKGKLS